MFYITNERAGEAHEYNVVSPSGTIDAVLILEKDGLFPPALSFTHYFIPLNQ